MSLEQGKVTFRICQLPQEMPEDTVERFREFAAGSLDNVGDEPEWGWVTPRHLLDNNITEDSVKLAGYYHICLRQAERKIPASLLNAECRLVELSRLAQSGAERLAKKERKDIKEEVRQRLLPQMPPQLSGIDMVIDNTERLLFTSATSTRALDILFGMFNKTFGFTPEPLTSETTAMFRFGIDIEDIPSICISPVMELADGKEANGTIGENFLTWLWFYQEARGGTLPPSKLGEFGLMIDGPLTFVSAGAGANESVVRKGTPTISAEAKAALIVGKKLKSAKFILAREGNQEWSCMLDPNEFVFRGLKLPEGEAMDPISIFEERMTNIFIFYNVFFGLYEKFLNEMNDSNRLNDYRGKARTWISQREEK